MKKKKKNSWVTFVSHYDCQTAYNKAKTTFICDSLKKKIQVSSHSHTLSNPVPPLSHQLLYQL